MSRKGLLPAVGLLAIAIVAALAVVLVSSFASGGEQSATSALAPDIDPGSARPPGGGLRADGIAAQGTLDPRITLFGDTIVAHVDVLLDRQRVDPASVRVGTEFLPWEIVGQPTRVRRDSGTDTHLRTTFALRCTGSPCIPPNQSAALEFDAARVSYAKPGAAPGDRTSIAVHWPVLLVYSRFAAANADGSTGTAGQNPWRADFISFPAATYRISPSLLLPVLIVLAGLLAAAGFVAGLRRDPSSPEGARARAGTRARASHRPDAARAGARAPRGCESSGRNGGSATGTRAGGRGARPRSSGARARGADARVVGGRPPRGADERPRHPGADDDRHERKRPWAVVVAPSSGSPGRPPAWTRTASVASAR